MLPSDWTKGLQQPTYRGQRSEPHPFLYTYVACRKWDLVAQVGHVQTTPAFLPCPDPALGLAPTQSLRWLRGFLVGIPVFSNLPLLTQSIIMSKYDQVQHLRQYSG